MPLLRTLILTLSNRYGLPALAVLLVALIALNYFGFVDNQSVMDACSYVFGGSVSDGV
jgi:hypothetical protein